MIPSLPLPKIFRRSPPSSADCGSDADLLKRFVGQHDEGAFAEIMQRHGPMVFGICRRVLHDFQDAEDVFQATFLVLVRKAGSLHNPHLLANWLYGVAYRIALQARAGAHRRRNLERQVSEMDAAEPVDEEMWQELRPLLDEEIERLPEKYRAPLILCHFEGKTYQEAANILGWPSGTVSGRLARAREKLRARLAIRGLTLSPVLLVGVFAQKGSAAIPQALLQLTLKSAILSATGQATAGVVSANAASLSAGFLKGAAAAKLKVLAGTMLAAAAVGAGVLFVWQWPAESRSRQERQLQEDREKLQGTWKLVASQEAGKELANVPVNGSERWTFHGDDLRIEGANGQTRWTCRLSRAFNTRRIDMRSLNPELPIARYGIYDFERGALWIRFSNNESNRPESFDRRAGEVRYEFKRE